MRTVEELRTQANADTAVLQSGRQQQLERLLTLCRSFDPERLDQADRLLLDLEGSAGSLTVTDFRHMSGCGNAGSIVHALSYVTAPSAADHLLDSFRANGSFRLVIVRIALDIQRVRARILLAAGCATLEQYLGRAGHGMPQTANERKLLAGHFGNELERDHFFAVLDPLQDLDDADRVNCAGRFFSWSEWPFSDQALSRRIHTWNVLLHSGDGNGGAFMSPFWLGHHHKGGLSGKIDTNAAIFWFDVATALGHGVAPLFSDDLLRAEASPELLDDPAFQERLSGNVKRAEELGFHCAETFLNRRYAMGRGEWNDQAKVQAYYEETVLRGDFWAPPQLSDYFSLCGRYVLYTEAEPIVAQHIQALEEIALQHASDFYKADLEAGVQRLRDIEKRKREEGEDYQKAFRAAAELIWKLYACEQPLRHHAKALRALLFDANVASTPAESGSAVRGITDAFGVARDLSRQEQWYIAGTIHALFEEANMLRLGLRGGELRASALRMGPFYNPIDATGSPVVGPFLAASETAGEESAAREALGYFAPRAGCRGVERVSLSESGDLVFSQRTDARKPALLLPEDFQVATALVFGKASGVLWPSLSLEGRDAALLDDEYESFSIKIWNPKWLGHTDFGRTLYIVDRLTGQLAWNPHSIPLALRPGEPVPATVSSFRNLQESIVTLAGPNRSSSSRLVNVSPEHIPLQVRKGTARGSVSIHVDVGRPKMRVNGAYIRGIGQEENRSIGWNDTAFLQGKLAQYLTDHWHTIAAALPVFARAAELMALLYALAELRKQVDVTPGAALNATAQVSLRKALTRFAAMGAVERKHLVLTPAPFIPQSPLEEVAS